MSTGVILLAAGSGRRFGRGVPKQLAVLAGKPLFLRPLEAFLGISSITEIVVVCSKRLLPKIKGILLKAKIKKKVSIVLGGVFRGESVKRGFLALSDKIKVVLVHDSARPLIDRNVIKRVENGARKFGVALAAWPLGDTLKVAKRNGQVKETIPRENLWLAQTPQGFRRQLAQICLTNPRIWATDDAQLAELKGFKVKIVEGFPTNLKVTFPHDLEICRALI